MIKKTLIAAAVALTSCGAFAGYYGGVHVGSEFVGSIGGDAMHRPGSSYSVVAGMGSGQVRAEVEMKHLESITAVYDEPMKATQLNANVFYDIESVGVEALAPYVGFGVGQTKFNDEEIANGGNKFTYQVIAGMSYGVNEDVTLFVDYRYQKSVRHLPVGGRFRTASIGAGVRYQYA